MHGDEEFFKFNLPKSKHLELQAPGSEKQTILHHAAYEDKRACIKQLVDSGIDINTGDYAKRTALHYAVRQNNAELVKYLLSLGAAVDVRTSNSGYTPLHIAVAMGNKEIIEILLKSGADIRAKCESGRTLGQSRSRVNQSSVLNFVCGRTVLRELLSHPGINFPPYFVKNSEENCKQTPIFLNEEMIKYLLEKGAETEVYDFSYDEKNATPLHRACEAGRLDVVQLLLDHDANLYSQDCFDCMVLHYAALGNNEHVVDLLLRKNLDINVKDKYNRTPLYNFVQENVTLINRGARDECRISMVEFLVDNGAEVNVQCGTVNNTPLHWASRLRNPHLTESLLELKANYKIKDKNGQVPFTINSFVNQNSETVSLTESGKVLIAFMALKENNFYDINDCNISDPKAMQLAEDFFEKCRHEAKKMKDTNFCHERRVTFYNFLSKELMKVSKFARSEEIMLFLESDGYKNEFPCYAFLIEKRIERIQEILFVESHLIKFIEEYANIKLPIVVVDKILSYLNGSDMRNFARAMSVLLKRENCDMKC